MTHRRLFAIALFASCAGTASAEVHRAYTSLHEYFGIIVPGAARADIDMPVIAAFSDQGELTKLLSANVPEAPRGDAVIEVLDSAGKQVLERAELPSDRYIPVLREALKLADASSNPNRRTVLLVRLATATPHGPQVMTVRDEDWEAALMRWHALAADRDLVILTLSTH